MKLESFEILFAIYSVCLDQTERTLLAKLLYLFFFPFLVTCLVLGHQPERR